LTIDNFLSNNVRRHGAGSDDTRRNSKAMKQRLDKMEKMVMQLILQQEKVAAGNEGSPDDNEDDVSQIGESLGMLKLDKKGKSVYHGDTHWGYLFSEVVQVQDFFSMLRSIYEGSSGISTETVCQVIEGATDYMAIPFAGTKYKQSSKDLLSNIPSRQVCEILIERYFQALEPIIHVVHRPSFQQQFEVFWQNPDDTDLLWVAQLLAMMVIGLQSFPMSEIPEPLKENPSELWTRWLDSIEMCGFLGRLTVKPSLLNMRVLILWVLVQSFNGDFIERSWTSMGLVIRVAQSMGLHRDPKWFRMTPFESQERRRIWTIASMLDTHVSIGQGLPFGARYEDTDMEPPRNIDDVDIMPDFAYIPQAKNIATKTDMSFLIFRNSLIQIQRKAYAIASNPKNSNESAVYADVWTLDAQLRKAYDNFPRFFRKKASETGLSEPLEIAIQRFFLEIDYLKTLVLLHRPFASTAKSNPRFRESKAAMVDSSYTVIERHYWLFKNPQAAVLKNRFFWVVSSLTFTYVIHAAMYIGISLWNNYDETNEHDRQKNFRALDMAIEMMDLVGVTISYELKQSVMVKILLSQVKEMGKMTPEQRRARSIKYRQQEAMGTAGDDNDKEGKGFTMELDASDVDIRLDYLETVGSKARNGPASRKPSSTATGSTNMDLTDEYSPASLNTNSSSHSKSITDDTPPSAQSFPLGTLYGEGNLNNDAAGMGLFQDGFGDAQKMQQIVGSEEWDNFMKGLEQEGFEGLKPLNPYF
jgi:Fungal specific transcription factor domain